MRFLGSIRTKSHRGQMFILATMLIAVYVVTMTAALMNLGAERLEFDRESLREPYLDSKREIQNYLELILAEYSKNNTNIFSASIAKTKIEDFLAGMGDFYFTRGVNLEVQLRTDNFNIFAKRPPYDNISNEAVYTSEIYAEFKLMISSVSSAFTIDESFTIVFVGRAEIQNNRILIQQSKGNQLEYINAAAIHIFNSTSRVIPIVSPDQTGIYYLEGRSNLENLGALNVTLNNGVQILS